MTRVGVVGCRFNTKRFIEALLDDGIPVDFLITIDPNIESVKNSGYVDLSQFAKDNGIDVYPSEKYAFGEKQKRDLRGQDFDIIFCVGWQRILPEWFLNLSRQGVFGMHGSCYRLPQGRGRSPQVWSIINGADEYHAHIFQYAAGADDGKLLHVETFDITPFDTAASLQVKSQLVFNRTIKNLWSKIKKNRLELTEQPEKVKPSYFPKRTPADGQINWHQGAVEIANFIRAQTTPYPGAFSYLENRKISMWKGSLFDTKLLFNEKAGTIIDVIDELGFIVQTGDFPLMVTKWSGSKPKRGLHFEEVKVNG